ncbi:hypothetical protein BJV82DRAFT_616087 [Fennellomyces sp. T-0311]|nr:hypothetical protein BJV82DRAFT_616087 [Fennellomyces sp. T-0311]
MSLGKISTLQRSLVPVWQPLIFFFLRINSTSCKIWIAYRYDPIQPCDFLDNPRRAHCSAGPIQKVEHPRKPKECIVFNWNANVRCSWIDPKRCISQNL